MVKEEVRNLSFLFTETGFVLDTVDREQQDSKWFQRFQEDKYSALYDFGFQERIHQLHASTGFLHRTAELYIPCFNIPKRAGNRQRAGANHIAS